MEQVSDEIPCVGLEEQVPGRAVAVLAGGRQKGDKNIIIPAPGALCALPMLLQARGLS